TAACMRIAARAARAQGHRGEARRRRSKAMSIHSKVTQWGNVSRFCVERLGDYSELLSIEASRMRTRLMREIIALVALAVAGLFTLSFVCIAIIATFWATPYFIYVVWAVAGAWLVLSIVALV